MLDSRWAQAHFRRGDALLASLCVRIYHMYVGTTNLYAGMCVCVYVYVYIYIIYIYIYIWIDIDRKIDR